MVPGFFSGPLGLAYTEALKLGILGAGAAAHAYHFPTLRSLADSIKVVAAADADPERGREVQRLFPACRIYPSAEELVRSADISAVAVLTPPVTHYSLALAAIRAGKHVFVEKPLA